MYNERKDGFSLGKKEDDLLFCKLTCVAKFARLTWLRIIQAMDALLCVLPVENDPRLVDYPSNYWWTRLCWRALHNFQNIFQVKRGTSVNIVDHPTPRAVHLENTLRYQRNLTCRKLFFFLAYIVKVTNNTNIIDTTERSHPSKYIFVELRQK